MSNLINKAKAAVSSNKSDNSPAYDNPQSTNDGPHKSNLMNKMDPRVDSDRDNRNNPQSHVGGQCHTQSGIGGHTQRGPDPVIGGAGVGHGTTGAVGTDYGQNTTPGTGVGHGNHGTHGQRGTGAVGTDYEVNTTPGTGDANRTAGPHDFNIANKVDPRVDSDMDGSRTTGGNATYR